VHRRTDEKSSDTSHSVSPGMKRALPEVPESQYVVVDVTEFFLRGKGIRYFRSAQNYFEVGCDESVAATYDIFRRNRHAVLHSAARIFNKTLEDQTRER